MAIKRSDFETYETLILSGQIEQHEAVRLLAENREFSDWYREKRKNPEVTNTKWSAQFGSE